MLGLHMVIFEGAAPPAPLLPHAAIRGYPLCGAHTPPRNARSGHTILKSLFSGDCQACPPGMLRVRPSSS